ncbi:hypothetical protein ACI2K4_20830 [Micromonospora sp. NPDC050397]|uniref:hypothetical protein n=1 Tax=Micromonospora sp. NPDC050397 TaxID=3364279 RepID=UPI00385166CA
MNPIGASVRSRRPRLAQVVRATVVVLWVVWATLAWWSAPRASDVDQARRDIAAGAVSSVATGWGWRNDPFWGATVTLQHGTGGQMVTWTTTSGRVRYLDSLPSYAVEFPAGQVSGNPPEHPVVTELRVAARTERSGIDLHRLGDIAQVAAALAMLVFLLALIPGPAPVVGTKWFWFWIAGIPFGLGLLVWAVKERWRPDPRTILTGQLSGVDGPIRSKRLTGFEGFLFAIGLGIALSIVAYGLSALLGTALVPG